MKALSRCLFILASTWYCLVASAADFAFDHGNAAVEVVFPVVAAEIARTVAPTASGAPLAFRVTTMLSNAWFDATAPYHPTAVGVYTRLGRQPEPVANTDLNIALLHASYQVLNSLLPQQNA